MGEEHERWVVQQLLLNNAFVISGKQIYPFVIKLVFSLSKIERKNEEGLNYILTMKFYLFERNSLTENRRM